MKLSLKATLMVLFTFIATAVTTTGWPGSGVEWAVFGVAALGTVIVHVAQSFVLPTTSYVGDVNWLDILKGAIIALGNFFSMFAASYLPGSEVDFVQMLESGGSVFLMYVIKQLAEKPKKP